MLDVHVLVMDYTRPEWLNKCRDTVLAAASAAGFPVHVHFVPGILGHLGRARYEGYSRGNFPYVTHVDDDDFVREDAFRILHPYLINGDLAITTGEQRLFENGLVQYATTERHHLAVYHRNVVTSCSYELFKFFPDQYLLTQVKTSHIPECVYTHRIREDSGSRTQRKENIAEASAEMLLIRNPELLVIENMTPLEIAIQQERLLKVKPYE